MPLYSISFQSTLPMRAATAVCNASNAIFVKFQSTLPMRAATRYPVRGNIMRFQISIHAAHAGSDHLARRFRHILDKISIHAAHAGSDAERLYYAGLCKISIHAAHAGSDQYGKFLNRQRKIFQSTLPMRAATSASIRSLMGSSINFNPRCPCGQRLFMFAIF